MMDVFFDPTMFADLLATSLRLSVPVVFAALGGVLAERIGVYNIGLEGMMLAGAFGAAAGTFFTGSPLVGLVSGILTGAMTAMILAVLAVSLGGTQIVAGIAINISPIGVTAFLSRIVFSGQANTMSLPGYRAFALPGLASIPILGPILFNQDALVYLMYVTVPLLFLLMFRTPWGLNIRAVGENPRVADTAGVLRRTSRE